MADRRVKIEELHQIAKEPFKRRADLLAFAAEQPGALTASFLSGVHLQMMQGQITKRSQLKDVSVSAWAQKHSHVSDMRDSREIASLGATMDKLQGDDVAGAMDVMTQRLLAIQTKNQKGQTWEKAEKLELIAGSSGSTASSAMLSLAS